MVEKLAQGYERHDDSGIEGRHRRDAAVLEKDAILSRIHERI
jgi:hypothetical protein